MADPLVLQTTNAGPNHRAPPPPRCQWAVLVALVPAIVALWTPFSFLRPSSTPVHVIDAPKSKQSSKSSKPSLSPTTTAAVAAGIRLPVVRPSIARSFPLPTQLEPLNLTPSCAAINLGQSPAFINAPCHRREPANALAPTPGPPYYVFHRAPIHLTTRPSKQIPPPLPPGRRPQTTTPPTLWTTERL